MNQKNIVIKTYRGLPEEARDIREEVFVEEQKFQEEFDTVDTTAVHLVMFMEGEPIACARFFPEGEAVYHIGRIAVKKSYRGKRLGEQIVLAAEEEVRRLGGKEIILSAQLRARGFYDFLGYKAYGEIYKEEYCDHIAMRKYL